MTRIRVLAGTRKGAFILTSDGSRTKWDVSGPHFAGWEIYHMKGSPADPDRIYASQNTGWFGQLIQRSDDGGATWQPAGNDFGYAGGDPLSNPPFNEKGVIDFAGNPKPAAAVISSIYHATAQYGPRR